MLREVDDEDGLCPMCFLTAGMETVVEVLSSQIQETLFENLIVLSNQAHQREQTDAAFFSLSAAYHAAYQPAQLEIIIREARSRVEGWTPLLDECGSVRAADYQKLVEEASQLRENMLAAMTGIPNPE